MVLIHPICFEVLVCLFVGWFLTFGFGIDFEFGC